MTKRITVHEDGDPVRIRVDNIRGIEPCSYGTEIELYSGGYITADEWYGIVEEMLCEAED